MPSFIIKTLEDVVGTYRVEADSPEEATAKFGDPAIDWESVEQLDYQAYSLEVDSVEEA